MSDNLSFLLTCAAECLNNWGYDGHGKHVDDGVKEIIRLRAENEKFFKQAEMNARLLTENASLRAENVQLLLEMDMQQATILVPSQKDDQRRIERLDAAIKEALDEAATVRAENEKLRKALKPFADAVKDECNWKYDINVDDFRAAAAAIRESGDEL